MSFLFSLLQNSGTFDKLTQGHYDAESNCGAVPECQETKDCIYRVCEPNRDAYGGTVYMSCVRKCNEDRFMEDFSDFACINPKTAYELYGIECENYQPKGFINLFGRELTLFQIASSILIFIIIYIIIKRI